MVAIAGATCSCFRLGARTRVEFPHFLTRTPTWPRERHHAQTPLFSRRGVQTAYRRALASFPRHLAEMSKLGDKDVRPQLLRAIQSKPQQAPDTPPALAGCDPSEVAKMFDAIVVGAPGDVGAVVAECRRRILRDGDGGTATLDREEDSTARVVPVPPETTGFVAWEKEGKPRGTAEWVLPKGWSPETDTGDRILFLHGGAYVWFSPSDGYRPLTTRLAARSGVPVLAIDYRLAPENPYPAAVVDGVDALDWIGRNGPGGPAAARTIFLVGDSAGGGLALATALAKLEPEGLPEATIDKAAAVRNPSAVVTLSAYTDLTCSFPSYRTRTYAAGGVHGDFVFSMGTADLDIRGSVEGVKVYHGDASPHLPTVSPIYARPGSLKALPPTLMLVGDAELMLSDTTEFAARAIEAGAHAVDVRVYRRMWHVWPMYSEGCNQGEIGTLEEAELAMAELVAFLDQYIGQAPP
eukprot:m.9957 g.9957  ORF g.9957 m.9957 type:complete len:466 (-) comp4253_c0_seq1:237-1634(-)